MKVLFIVPYPSEGASNRFRVEQYLPYLGQAGIYCSLRPFFTRNSFRVLYKKRKTFKKAAYLLLLTARRIKDLLDSRHFDVVFIHREVFPFGSFFERLLKLFNKKIIFDFDDALFLPNVSDSNRLVRVFKGASKLSNTIKISSKVIAGNNFLRDYALNFNRNVIALCTPIDTDKYFPVYKNFASKKITIGWMGSITTVKYLNLITGVFNRLLNKYVNLRLMIVGGEWGAVIGDRIYCKEWLLSDEVSDLQSFDIGIMPLADDDWSRGKCAFKAIEYMAVGIPVVASDVGMNKEVIKDGENGYLAKSEAEWEEKLSFLIDNAELRRRMGKAGRIAVEEKYSVKANLPAFLRIIEETYKKRGGS